MSDVELFREYKDKLNKLNYALFIMSFDVETVCPKKDRDYSYSVQEYFENQVMDIILSDDYYELLCRLDKNNDGLTDIECKAIKKELKDLKKQRRIPKKLQKEGIKIVNDSSLAWMKAYDTLNYDDFEHKLEKLVDYNFKTLPYLEDKYKGFDALLENMEEGYSTKEYDALFNALENEILPLMKKILQLPKKYNKGLLNEKFDIDKQKRLTKKICALMGYTNENGYIGETLHPFTNSANVNDVRTTTKYDEALLFSNLYSVMHEVGHALYELQNNEELSGTYLFGGTSMGIHESQSRFYENYLGRSKEFIEFLYPILVEEFGEQISKYSVDDIYYYVNDVSNQFYRTEADELTYPFHVLIRYKIEKMLFNKEITVYQISDKFNELFKDYFGMTPSNKKEGCFQDVHWSSGFGYFPTYVLGNANAAMMLEEMKKDFNPYEDMKSGNFKNVNEWLRVHVHQFGSSLSNKEVLYNACHKEFTEKPYIAYLKDKFTKLYNL